MRNKSIENMKCDEFASMPENEQRAFVIGVAIGRGMTSRMFRTCACAAEDFAATDDERAAIARNFETICSMVLPLLEVDTGSLLNGIRVASNHPDFRNELVIKTLVSVHTAVAKVLMDYNQSEQT